MFLQRLTLKNVRAIKELDLSLAGSPAGTRRWTMLLGENGSGKSTVLKALALLLAGSDSMPELLGEPDHWIRLGAQQAQLSADLATAEGAVRNVSLTLRRGETVTSTLSRNSKRLRQLDDALAHSPRSYLSVGYGVSRRVSSAQVRSLKMEEFFRSPRARSVATLFNPDATLHAFEAWAMDLDYRHGKRGLALVKAVIKDFLPGVSFSRIDRRRRRLLFKTPDGELPLSSLSDGYQNVAAWCGDLIYRITETFQDYQNPLATRGLLMVDEIDLHLHPVWQRQLRRFLNDKLPNLQILATTHSALTAQQCGEGELFVLKRETVKQAPSLFGFPGDPQKLLLHQLLLSDLFGLESLNSPQVQEKKVEYRALAAKKKPTKRDRARAGKLKAELQEVPDWTRETKADVESRAFVQQLNKALGSPVSTARAIASPVSQRKLVKVTGHRPAGKVKTLS